MKNLLLGIVIGLCIIAFVKASNPLDLGQVVWLPAMTGTVNGHGYELGLAPDVTILKPFESAGPCPFSSAVLRDCATTRNKPLD
jgi:hypothetical protein